MKYFDRIAEKYKSLRKIQDKLTTRKLENKPITPSQLERYQQHKAELIQEIEELPLNQNRIDGLVIQLAEINKKLSGLEGQLMRLADSYGIERDDFINQLENCEFNQNWIQKISNISKASWKNFIRSEEKKNT